MGRCRPISTGSCFGRQPRRPWRSSEPAGHYTLARRGRGQAAAFALRPTASSYRARSKRLALLRQCRRARGRQDQSRRIRLRFGRDKRPMSWAVDSRCEKRTTRRPGSPPALTLNRARRSPSPSSCAGLEKPRWASRAGMLACNCTGQPAPRAGGCLREEDEKRTGKAPCPQSPKEHLKWKSS